jgi:ATP-dependent RNA circularization protein (DNA/RNA ligase family)
MSDFFRFPHTPHIAWLGNGIPRDDKVLSPQEADKLLSDEVVVEEKLDGANLGISVSPEGDVRAQNRGQYLQLPIKGQFDKLNSWLKPRSDALFDALGVDLILFGEWCAARHSLDYDYLPDWLLVFDVYDKKSRQFWSTHRRNTFAAQLNLPVVPRLLQGKTNINELKERLKAQSSDFRQGSLEGVVIRSESSEWLKSRAKLVRPDFVQSISEHWSHRQVEWNHLGLQKNQQV